MSNRYAIFPMGYKFQSVSDSKKVYILCKYTKIKLVGNENDYRGVFNVELLKIVGDEIDFYNTVNTDWEECFIPRRDKDYFEIYTKDEIDPDEEPILFKFNSDEDFLEAADLCIAVEGGE